MTPQNSSSVVKNLTMKRRLVAVRAKTSAELREMIINRDRGVLWPATVARIPQDEPVLLDIRLPGTESRVVLRAKCTYTVPEGLGPMFVCAREDRLAFAQLLRVVDAPRPVPRAFPRYPAAIDATVRVDGSADDAPLRARVVDLSAAGARIEVDASLADGAPIVVEMPGAESHTLPQRLTARVIGSRQGGMAVHFDGPDFESWRALRVALRHAHETGMAPTLGS